MNESTINQIKELRTAGKSQDEIAKQIGVSQKTISYWLCSEEDRQKVKKKAIDYFKNLPLYKRRLVYKRRLPYLKIYFKNRYKNDEVFRVKQIDRVKRYKKMKGGKTR